LFALVLTLAMTAAGDGAPVSGPEFYTKDVFFAGVSGSDTSVVAFEGSEVFRGGQRAAVIANSAPLEKIADNPHPRAGGILSIFVYDRATHQLVAQDTGGTDLAAAVWYPARDTAYMIEIHNAGKSVVKGYVSYK